MLSEDFFLQNELLTPADLSKHVRKYLNSASFKNRSSQQQSRKICSPVGLIDEEEDEDDGEPIEKINADMIIKKLKIDGLVYLINLIRQKSSFSL